MTPKPVAIIMGSQSDWSTMKHAAKTLDALGIGYEARIVSAHRTPKRLYDFAGSARKNGFKVIIAGAGGAAHLPGMAASMTPLPVFGVPMNTHALEGEDSLLYRQARRDQRRAPGGRRPCAVRRKDRETAGCLARAADEVRGQTAEGLNMPLAAHSARLRASGNPVQRISDSVIVALAPHLRGVERSAAC